MTRAFTDIAQLIGQVIPPWALVPLVLLLALAALPFWLQSVKGKQISGLARRMVRAPTEEREQMLERVLALAGSKPALLRTAIEQAIKYDHLDLRKRALAALEDTGKAPQDVAQIRAKLEPEPKPVPHPLEVAVNVERLIGEGMFDTARLRLDEALIRYPRDSDLLALRARVDEARVQLPPM